MGFVSWDTEARTIKFQFGSPGPMFLYLGECSIILVGNGSIRKKARTCFRILRFRSVLRMKISLMFVKSFPVSFKIFAFRPESMIQLKLGTSRCGAVSSLKCGT